VSEMALQSYRNNSGLAIKFPMFVQKNFR